MNAAVIPYKTNSPRFVARVVEYKNVELIVKICQQSFMHSLTIPENVSQTEPFLCGGPQRSLRSHKH